MGSIGIVAEHAEDLWYVTRQQHLDAERVAPTKSEWVDGVVFSMAGASKRHVAAVARLVEPFAGSAREKGCLFGCSATSSVTPRTVRDDY